VLRKSDKSSAATGALAAETAAGGDGTAVEAAGDSPNLRRGFAERPVGVKTAKIYLADARAAEMSAARTDANVGVVLNRIAMRPTVEKTKLARPISSMQIGLQ